MPFISMLIDPDPHSKHRSRSKADTWMRWMRIHVDPDPQHCLKVLLEMNQTQIHRRHRIVNVSIFDEKTWIWIRIMVLKLAM
jgi:hypothetical protein